MHVGTLLRLATSGARSSDPGLLTTLRSFEKKPAGREELIIESMIDGNSLMSFIYMFHQDLFQDLGDIAWAIQLPNSLSV